MWMRPGDGFYTSYHNIATIDDVIVLSELTDKQFLTQNTISIFNDSKFVIQMKGSYDG